MITINTQGMSDAFNYAAGQAGRFASSAGHFARNVSSSKAKHMGKVAGLAFLAARPYINQARGDIDYLMTPSSGFDLETGASFRTTLFSRTLALASQAFNDSIRYRKLEFAHLGTFAASAALVYTGAAVPAAVLSGLRYANIGLTIARTCPTVVDYLEDLNYFGAWSKSTHLRYAKDISAKIAMGILTGSMLA